MKVTATMIVEETSKECLNYEIPSHRIYKFRNLKGTDTVVLRQEEIKYGNER